MVFLFPEPVLPELSDPETFTPVVLVPLSL